MYRDDAEALLTENEALRDENKRLEQELALLKTSQRGPNQRLMSPASHNEAVFEWGQQIAQVAEETQRMHQQVKLMLKLIVLLTLVMGLALRAI